MDELLIKLAQRAAQQAESRPEFLASAIKRYGQQEGLGWEGIAQRLKIDRGQLAKLALCRRPRRTNYAEDMAQIAEYVGMDRALLKEFLQAAEPSSSRMGLTIDWSAFGRGLKGLSKHRMWALGAAALVLLVMGAVAFAQPRGSSATLVVAEGEATVAQAQIAFLPSRRTRTVVATGDIISINAGDSISVGAGSAAQIRLFDGSTVDLSENTTLEVRELVTTEESYRVDLKMLTGKTINRVVRLLGAGDAFRVSTPSSTASVRGTVFTVEVISPDTTYVACDKGIVQVETDGQEVEVAAGTEVLAVVGKPLEVAPQPAGPPDDKPAVPPAGGGKPPGPPEEVPGNPPADTPGQGQPPADDGEPPGPPEEVPGNPPADTPAGPPDNRPNGPPEQVPGHTPREVPGQGNPPAGNGEPPGHTKSRSKRPFGIPPGPPEDVPGIGNPGNPDKPPKNNPNGPPAAVPGHPPADTPGQGNPPDAGGDPPGQDNNSSDDNNAGGNTDNNAGGNNSSANNAGGGNSGGGNNAGGNSGGSTRGGKKGH